MLVYSFTAWGLNKVWSGEDIVRARRVLTGADAMIVGRTNKTENRFMDKNGLFLCRSFFALSNFLI